MEQMGRGNNKHQQHKSHLIKLQSEHCVAMAETCITSILILHPHTTITYVGQHSYKCTD